MKTSKKIICAIIVILLILLISYVIISMNRSYKSFVNISYGDDERHHLDLVIPKGDEVCQGVILYIHGGGWIGGDKDAFLDILKEDAKRGYISAAINYRYANGNNVTCEDILDDIDAALGEINIICINEGISVDKVMLVGISAGAHLSLMYAYTRDDTAPIKPVAVASFVGPTDLYDSNFYTTTYREDVKMMISMISGADIVNGNITDYEEQLVIASPISYVDEYTVPTIICHGTADELVPYSNATNLYKLLCEYGVECELITFEDSGHGLESDPEASEYAERRFYEFAEKYLR